MNNVTYGIDDGHSNVISSGLSEREVQAAARRAANRLSKSVYWYRETRTEQEIADEVYPESTEVEPSGYTVECRHASGSSHWDREPDTEVYETEELAEAVIADLETEDEEGAALEYRVVKF